MGQTQTHSGTETEDENDRQGQREGNIERQGQKKERRIDALFRDDVLFPSPPKFSATERDVEKDREKEIRRETHADTGTQRTLDAFRVVFLFGT